MTHRAYPYLLLALLGSFGCDDDLRVVDQPVKDSGLPECGDPLPAGPIEPEVLREDLVGSEDIAISSNGTVAARKDKALVKIIAGGDTQDIVADFPGSAGMRFTRDGNLAVAIFAENRVVKVSSDGTTEDLLTDVMSPNGIWADSDGRVWVTSTGSGKLIVIDSDGTAHDVATGLTLPNGVAYDPKRKLVFVDELGSGNVYRVAVKGSSEFGEKELVATLPPSSLPDGATLDACGNLYVIAFGSKKLFRIQLDDEGNAKQDPEEIVTFPGEVANPVFARGIAPTEIYVTGAPGTVYRANVGSLAADDAP